MLTGIKVWWLARGLRSKDTQVRVAAAKRLGELGGPRAVELLITALADRGFCVRVATAGALGDLGDARAVWKLLTASTAKAAEGPMEQIGVAHAQTKRLYREMLGQAQDQASRLHFRDQYVMVVGRRGWHPGLVGPIAAQLTQRYGRPAIAIALEERVGVGSGRFELRYAF